MFVQTLDLALLKLLRLELDRPAHSVALAQGMYTQFVRIYILQHYNQSLVAVHLHIGEVDFAYYIVHYDKLAVYPLVQVFGFKVRHSQVHHALFGYPNTAPMVFVVVDLVDHVPIESGIFLDLKFE